MTSHLFAFLALRCLLSPLFFAEPLVFALQQREFRADVSGGMLELQ